VFCYLNDVPAGGATHFNVWQQTVTPATGRVVRFSNCLANGAPNPDSVHAGLPVQAGDKWLATLWFRERPLRAW
jgi:prolyl 4-hydroxylase